MLTIAVVFLFPIILFLQWNNVCSTSNDDSKGRRKCNDSDLFTKSWLTSDGSVMDDVSIFQLIAGNNNISHTDKVRGHNYAGLYGTHLLPYLYRHQTNGQSVRFLEIGMGCNRNYENKAGRGTGMGIMVWNHLLSSCDDKYVAEFDTVCAKKHIGDQWMKGWTMLYGDQSNSVVLKEWINISKGSFDIIVDDGGHKNTQIYESLKYLWPRVKPGGYYFVEDLQVSKPPPLVNGYNMVEIFHMWQDVLLYGPRLGKNATQNIKNLIPIPLHLASISCHFESCVLQKCGVNKADNRRPFPTTCGHFNDDEVKE